VAWCCKKEINEASASKRDFDAVRRAVIELPGVIVGFDTMAAAARSPTTKA
jgi:hypothetical protein